MAMGSGSVTHSAIRPGLVLARTCKARVDRTAVTVAILARALKVHGCPRRTRRCHNIPGARQPSRLSLIMAGWTLGSVGRAAARAARSSGETHRSVLRLLDELVTIGKPVDRPSLDLERVGAPERLLPHV